MRGISRVQCRMIGWLPTLTWACSVVNPNISTRMFQTPGAKSNWYRPASSVYATTLALP
jgi:hypothetical protein